MPALNFQARFAEDVEAGRKRQTMRAPRRDGRPHATQGSRLYLYTGMRTKACRKLGEADCRRTRQVVVNDWEVFVDGARVDDEAFAKADGFENAAAMYDWVRAVHGVPFEGSLIEW